MLKKVYAPIIVRVQDFTTTKQRLKNQVHKVTFTKYYILLIIIRLLHLLSHKTILSKNFMFLMVVIWHYYGRLQRGFQSLLWSGWGCIQHYCAVWSKCNCEWRISAREIMLGAKNLHPLGRHSHYRGCSKFCSENISTGEALGTILQTRKNVQS